MKLLEKRWFSLLLASLVWLVGFIIVFLFLRLAFEPVRSPYDSVYYMCDGGSFLNKLPFECEYSTYVANVLFVQLPQAILGSFTYPVLALFYSFIFSVSGEDFLTQLTKLPLSMGLTCLYITLVVPYIAVPVLYGLLRLLNKYLKEVLKKR